MVLIPQTTSAPTPLRAPWLWILLPGLAGYWAADAVPSADIELLVVAGLASGVLAWTASVRLAWELAWAPTFVTAVGCLAAAHFLLVEGVRKPATGLLTLPPRELDLKVEVVRLFESEESDSTKGIGSVLQAPLVRKDLVGKRLYFRLKKNAEKDFLLRGAVFSARGVLYPVTGKSGSGFDEFLASKGVHYHFLRGIVLHREAEAPRWIRLCRRWNEGLEKTLLAGAEDEDETRANLLVAMLLGKKSAIPAERKKQFVVAGAMHLFAISGLHVGIVAALLVFLLLFLPGPKWVETWVLLVLLFVYVEVTGGAPSARRAFVMIAFWRGAHHLGRKGGAFPALVAAAVFTLAWDPRQLWDRGFQLSYSVVASIILFGGPLSEKLQAWLRPWPSLTDEELVAWRKAATLSARWFANGLGISISATLAGAPLTVDAFGVFSPGGIFLNVFLVLMAMGAIWLGVIGLPFSAWGIDFIHEAAWWVVSCMDGLVAVGIFVPGLFFHASCPVSWLPEFTVSAYLAICLLSARRFRNGHGARLFPAPLVLVFFIAFGCRLSLV